MLIWYSISLIYLFAIFNYRTGFSTACTMPGGAETKAKKKRKGGDRKDKEKPLLSVQVGIFTMFI